MARDCRMIIYFRFDQELQHLSEFIAMDPKAT